MVTELGCQCYKRSHFVAQVILTSPNKSNQRVLYQLKAYKKLGSIMGKPFKIQAPMVAGPNAKVRHSGEY